MIETIMAGIMTSAMVASAIRIVQLVRGAKEEEDLSVLGPNDLYVDYIVPATPPVKWRENVPSDDHEFTYTIRKVEPDEDTDPVRIPAIPLDENGMEHLHRFEESIRLKGELDMPDEFALNMPAGSFRLTINFRVFIDPKEVDSTTAYSWLMLGEGKYCRRAFRVNPGENTLVERTYLFTNSKPRRVCFGVACASSCVVNKVAYSYTHR